MVDILRTGLTGLIASQRALAVVSHNIANAADPDFTRQRPQSAALGPARGPLSGTVGIGRGVEIRAVERVYDEFLTRQVRDAAADLAEAETLEGTARMVGDLLGDGDNGLLSSLERFFGALHDVADAPTSIPARTVLLESGRQLTERLRAVDGDLRDLAKAADRDVQNTLAHINTLTRETAALNREITAAGDLSETSHDLLDRRDALLRELAAQVGIATVTQSNGAIDVFVGQGQALIVGGFARTLEASPAADDPQRLTVRLRDQAGGDLGASLDGGRLGGLLDRRDGVVSRARNELGLLAVALGTAFNELHTKGMDLNGASGATFFAMGQPAVTPHAENSGSAVLNVAIADGEPLTGADYEVIYSGTQYEIRRLSDGAALGAFSGSGPITIDGLEFGVAGGSPGTGDRFLVHPTRDAIAGLAVRLTSPAEIAAALPVAAEGDPANGGAAVVGSLAVADAANGNLRNEVRLEFTTPTTFDVIDNTLGTVIATGEPYVAGQPIAFNGWRLVLEGVPASGDAIRVADNAGGVGDNRNALQMANLGDRAAVRGGTTVLGELLPGLIASVGAEGASAAINLEARAAMMTHAEAMRASVSGVNLDEEAAALLRYQESYQAAAELIRVADSLFQTILRSVQG